MALNESLPMELEARVHAHVASGLYGSASEVIREALRLFEAYQSVQQSNLAALKVDIDQGMADLDAGRVSKMDMAAIKVQGRELNRPCAAPCSGAGGVGAGVVLDGVDVVQKRFRL